MWFCFYICNILLAHFYMSKCDEIKCFTILRRWGNTWILKNLIIHKIILKVEYGWKNIKIGSSDLMCKQGVK
jgi:hypothetical protein